LFFAWVEAIIISMMFLLFSLAIAVAFVAGSLLLMNLGRRLGNRHIARQGGDPMAGLNAIESAVFALMGLILAFALSGALQRFDERRELILQEANAISTAYDRLDLIEAGQRKLLKAKVKEYLGARLELYRLPADFSLEHGMTLYSPQQMVRILALKKEIWNAAMANCPADNVGAACALIVPSLNAAFEAARLRTGVAERHPPQIIYVMLFGLGLGGALMAGFSMAASRNRSWLHMAAYAAALGFVLYIITDIEFPRLGLIQVNYFDHFLQEVYDQMV
jgi:hypothetical protein